MWSDRLAHKYVPLSVHLPYIAYTLVDEHCIPCRLLCGHGSSITVLAGPLLNFYREKKDFQQVTSSYTQTDGTLFYTHVMPMKTTAKPHFKTADHPHIDTTY